MTRRIGVALFAMTAWVLVLGMALQSAPAAAAQSGFRFLDRFSSGDYGGNHGSTPFNSAWWEYVDGGGPDRGDVTVESGGGCPHERCARISGDDERLAGTGLARRAKLTGAATATLRFKYRFDLNAATAGHFNVAVHNGNRWIVLDSFNLDDKSDNGVHTRTYEVTEYANHHFYVGFFAHGQWDGDLYIDNVEIFGQWDDSTTTTSTTTTTIAPTTTTTTVAPTTTTTSTTVAPTTSTTTTVPPTTSTTSPPTVTTVPPTTSVAPTTEPPSTSVATAPPTTVAPTTTTTRPPEPTVPLARDERYTLKGELAMLIKDDLMALPSDVATIPSPNPVTQIAATVTTTAVTLRSHLLPASALGLLIAIAAVGGMGRLEQPVRIAKNS
ncbi:MAG: hypothetical protein GY720_01220 [bacterium]|nr:hypothetical protein [bacterium]